MNLLENVRGRVVAEQPLGVLGLLGCAVVCIVAATAAAAMPETSTARWFLAGVIALVLVFIGLRSTTQAVIVTFVWLFALGMSRRLASEVLADPGRDPFLLVAPAAVAMLGLRALLAGALRRMTVLAWLVLAFSVLVLAQMANPDNPSGFARVAGLLVWLVPTLWFWVGRSLGDDKLGKRILLLVVGASTTVALYGIGQSVVKFPPWDQRWINLRGYAALYIGPTTVRPFGSYASAAEFGLACAVGAIVAATMVFIPRLLQRVTQNRRAARRQWRGRVAIMAVGLVCFLITSMALVLSAIRTYLFLLLVALPIVYLVARGWRAWKVLVPALLLAALALAALSQVDPNSFSKDGAQAGVRRVIVALNDPFVSSKENTDNTLQLHWESAKGGVRAAFEHPTGYGTGTVGITGEHFGGPSISTDFDVSDAGIAFGVLGVVLATAIILTGLYSSIRVATSRRTFERVAIVGVLLVSFGSWFQGNHYAMAPLLWLLLGRADAAFARRREPDPDGERADGQGDRDVLEVDGTEDPIMSVEPGTAHQSTMVAT